MQNNVISILITSLYRSQPSSVVFACRTKTFGSELQVSMGPRFRLLICECKTATLVPELQVSMGPRPHLWFFAFKTATLAPELIVSMDLRPHLWFCACKTAWLTLEILVSMGPRPHLSVCAFKTTQLASELLVSMGPSPHLWFLHAKQRLLDQNYTIDHWFAFEFSTGRFLWTFTWSLSNYATKNNFDRPTAVELEV